MHLISYRGLHHFWLTDISRQKKVNKIKIKIMHPIFVTILKDLYNVLSKYRLFVLLCTLSWISAYIGNWLRKMWKKFRSKISIDGMMLRRSAHNRQHGAKRHSTKGTFRSSHVFYSCVWVLKLHFFYSQ